VVQEVYAHVSRPTTRRPRRWSVTCSGSVVWPMC